MVNIGDKVVITKLNGEVLEEPRVATVKYVGETWFEIDEVILGEDIVMKESSVDEWYMADSTKNLEKTDSTPKEGQLVKVVCDGLAEFGEVVETDVTEAGEYEFKVKSGESSTTYKMNEVDSIETYKGDEDKIMPNYIQLASAGEKITEESLNFRSIETYKGDEGKIMPNYIQLASQGMTFSEFAGEDITEESLNFRPYDDKVNHPNHYNKYSREVIESIKGLCTPDEFRGYLKGNIIKYSARYSDKDGIQDIDKLAKYTQFLKEFELEMAELSEEE